MYQIKINYDTGDTFNHEYGVEDVLDDISWETIDQAKIALKAIHEHYEYKLFCGGYVYASKSKTKRKRRIKESKKFWFVEDDEYHTKIYLINDKNQKQLICAFWCDHFSSLNGAEIVSTLKGDNLKFTI